MFSPRVRLSSAEKINILLRARLGWCSQTMSSKSVIVIGGGLAGLSSAVALAEAGFRVRLLEKRPHLGGRAASYVLPGGEQVDNCQHVTLGAARIWRIFTAASAPRIKIRFFDRLCLPDRRRASATIDPFGAAAAVAHGTSFAYFPRSAWRINAPSRRRCSRLRAAGGAVLPAMRRASRCSRGCRRSADAARDRRFWEVMLVSALDEDLSASTRATESMFSGRRFLPTAADIASAFPRSARRFVRRLPRSHHAQGRGSAVARGRARISRCEMAASKV